MGYNKYLPLFFAAYPSARRRCAPTHNNRAGRTSCVEDSRSNIEEEDSYPLIPEDRRLWTSLPMNVPTPTGRDSDGTPYFTEADVKTSKGRSIKSLPVGSRIVIPPPNKNYERCAFVRVEPTDASKLVCFREVNLVIYCFGLF